MADDAATITVDFRTEPAKYKHWKVSVNGPVATLAMGRQILGVVGQLFTGKVSLRQMQGVIGIARESGRAAKRGTISLINLMAVISLNLAI